MKRFGLSCAVGIFLLLGSFAFSQDPQEPKPPQHEETRPESEREAPRANQSARPDEANPKQEQERQEKEKQEAAKPPQDTQPPEHQPMQRTQDHQAQSEHARPAGKSAHIPDEKFRAGFGRQHTFVVSRPTIVEGQPRFQYSGYWFEIVDPWPSAWLYTDDVYVDYIDGEYFLFDLLHPGVRVAVFVVM